MTTRAPQLPRLLLAAALLLGAVGCGVDASDDTASGSADTGVEDTTTTEAEGTTTTEDGGDDETTTTEADEPTTTTEADEPDVTAPSVPEGFEEQFRDQLEVGFKSAGLDDEQAACLADAYVAEFGSDTGSATDFEAMLDLFEGCDIDPTQLGAG